MGIAEPDELLNTLVDLDYSKLRYEMKKLRAIRDWAIQQIDVDYHVGDHVRIKADWRLDVKKAPGWAAYREALSPGAPATVMRLDFNEVYGYWYAEIILDREWSNSSPSSPVGEKRWWHGPVGETPEGMEPPTAFDQERYPQGRKHTFSFRATALEKAEVTRETGDEKEGTLHP